MRQWENEPIRNKRELEFAVFCIENVALSLGVSAEKVYSALTEKSNILNGYIIPCYDALHSQGKEYIVEDIIALMERKGVFV
ncbi:MAG: DUF3791 domain-containing protein [Clostridium sp.]|nr:DUF3791 domain-containing protein [Clostridium sp.]